jgi:hypothetical protein
MPSDTIITAPVQRSRFQVSEFYTQVRSNCNLRTSNRVADSEILAWLNEAQDEIAQETHWYRTSTSINLTAGTKEYDLPATPPTLTVEEVWYNPTQKRLIPMTPDDLEGLSYYSPTWRYASRGEPIYFYINVNSAIGLHPTPDTTTASALFVVYTGMPPRATGSSDYIFHPAGHERTVVNYACWRASLKDVTGEGGKKVDAFRAAWVEGLAKCKRQIEALYEDDMTVFGEYGTPLNRSYTPRSDWMDGTPITGPG